MLGPEGPEDSPEGKKAGKRGSGRTEMLFAVPDVRFLAGRHPTERESRLMLVRGNFGSSGGAREAIGGGTKEGERNTLRDKRR